MPTTDPSAYPAEIRTGNDRLHPFEWFAEMRATDRVRYDSDRGVWDVFGYADVTAVLTDHQTYSSEPIVRETTTIPATLEPVQEMFVATDPPEHTERRGHFQQFFSPRALAQYESRLSDHTRRIYRETTADSDQFDFVQEFALNVSIATVAEILGLPADARERFETLLRATVLDPPRAGDSSSYARFRSDSTEKLLGLFRDVLDSTEPGPDDTLLSLIARAGSDGSDRMSRDVQLGACLLFAVAGTVTTTCSFANTLWTIFEEDLERAVVTGDLDVPSLYEEVLRYRSPLQKTKRVASRDATVSGKQISRGETVVLWISSANRDGAVFDDPDEFDPARRNQSHIAFGAGVHNCLGAPLARLEARVALGTFVDLVSEVRPTARLDELEPWPSNSEFGPKALPVVVK